MRNFQLGSKVKDDLIVEPCTLFFVGSTSLLGVGYTNYAQYLWDTTGSRLQLEDTMVQQKMLAGSMKF